MGVVFIGILHKSPSINPPCGVLGEHFYPFLFWQKSVVKFSNSMSNIHVEHSLVCLKSLSRLRFSLSIYVPKYQDCYFLQHETIQLVDWYHHFDKLFLWNVGTYQTTQCHILEDYIFMFSAVRTSNFIGSHCVGSIQDTPIYSWYKITLCSGFICWETYAWIVCRRITIQSLVLIVAFM
jgi:hypothetical protein